ncbi:MAG: AmmeMemoRadiSam system protein B [Acidimicrobiia bacterium]|nr:AmmeMemoRadiSam system protein B [Acidimicrobiia bacterium]
MREAETRARVPAVAGAFYPADPAALAGAVDRYIAAARYDGRPPKALVVPHAGYAYSGPVAGTGYATVLPARSTVTRVVLLGPAHRVRVAALAAPGADSFLTPLGPVEIDADARATALTVHGVEVDDGAHAPEHSIEVQLPFLQRTLGSFRVLPIVVGHPSADAVARVLEELWGGPETLIVVSTDLSHYLDYESAAEHDLRTARAITALDVEGVADRDACGAYALRGLLRVAAAKGLEARLLDLRSSGDTAGSRDSVVGYGAVGFWEPTT